jgi:hypothetical protein
MAVRAAETARRESASRRSLDWSYARFGRGGAAFGFLPVTLWLDPGIRLTGDE